jgi:hypothetical protein
MRLDRSFFELQAAFAERVADIACIDRAEAFRLYTTFYWIARDNDAGRPATSWDFDPNHPEWKRFVSTIEGGVYSAELATPVRAQMAAPSGVLADLCRSLRRRG